MLWSKTERKIFIITAARQAFVEKKISEMVTNNWDILLEMSKSLDRKIWGKKGAGSENFPHKQNLV